MDNAFMNAGTRESLSFRRIRTEKSCLYVGISSLGIGSVGLAVNKLFFGNLFYHSKEAFNGVIPGLENPLDAPIAVFFDELSSTVNTTFIDLQNKCRASGIQLTYATQCPAYALEDDRRSNFGTEREVEEFIAHANIFRGLKVGQCIFIQRTPKRVDLLNVKPRLEFRKMVEHTADNAATSSIF